MYFARMAKEVAAASLHHITSMAHIRKLAE
jgi:hypothetical protein